MCAAALQTLNEAVGPKHPTTVEARLYLRELKATVAAKGEGTKDSDTVEPDRSAAPEPGEPVEDPIAQARNPSQAPGVDPPRSTQRVASIPEGPMPAHIRPNTRKLLSILAVALTFPAAVPANSLGPSGRLVRQGSALSPTHDPAFHRAECARIQAHLARVEARLRAHAPAGLTAVQRTARAVTLNRLAAYRRAGVFPHNHDFIGRLVPCFVDAHGTRCAMAYLIEAAGHSDVVRAVRASANNARVAELAAMPAFSAALRSALGPMGLTVEEAQAIQPTYGWEEYGIVRAKGEKLTTEHKIAAASAGSLALGATVGNVIGPSSGFESVAFPALGFLAGGITLGVGAAHLDNPGDPTTLGIAEVFVGGISILTAGARAIRGRGQRSTPTPATSSTPLCPELQLACSGDYRVGLRLRF